MTYPRWPPPNWATSGLEFKMFIPRSNELSRLCLTMFVCFLNPASFLRVYSTHTILYPPPRNRLVQCLAPRHEFMEYHQFCPSFALIALFITLKLRCFYCFFSTYLYPRFQTWLHFPVRDSRVEAYGLMMVWMGINNWLCCMHRQQKNLPLFVKGLMTPTGHEPASTQLGTFLRPRSANLIPWGWH